MITINPFIDIYELELMISIIQIHDIINSKQLIISINRFNDIINLNYEYLIMNI